MRLQKRSHLIQDALLGIGRTPTQHLGRIVQRLLPPPQFRTHEKHGHLPGEDVTSDRHQNNDQDYRYDADEQISNNQTIPQPPDRLSGHVPNEPKKQYGTKHKRDESDELGDAWQ